MKRIFLIIWIQRILLLIEWSIDYSDLAIMYVSLLTLYVLKNWKLIWVDHQINYALQAYSYTHKSTSSITLGGYFRTDHIGNKVSNFYSKILNQSGSQFFVIFRGKVISKISEYNSIHEIYCSLLILIFTCAWIKFIVNTKKKKMNKLYPKRPKLTIKYKIWLHSK